MSDREKVIKGIQECDLNGGLIGNCPYKGILELLKERENEIDEISDEYLDLGQEMAKQPKIVRCKDCNNGVIHCGNGDIICDHIDSSGNDTHPADWFCADGEKKNE